VAIKYVEGAPREVRFRPDPDDIASKLDRKDVEQIAELFHTPLTGAYVWNYEEADKKIRKLYRLGKERNWNADSDVDWSITFPRNESPVRELFNPFIGYEPFEKMTEAERVEFAWHQECWTLSQFLHGEQGALLVASQLVSCAPTYDAKLYAASQTFDEARHVEAFGRYLMEKVGFMYPVDTNLKALLDKILTDERWDLKFIGMQLIVESLALAAFNTQKLVAKDKLITDIIDLVIRDESRHVAFGVTYMEEFVKSLSPQEIEDRAHFAYEACVIMRERIIGNDVFSYFGWPEEKSRQIVLEAKIMDEFRNLLFTRIMPNLKKVGLITDSVRPLYDKLGVLQLENLGHDGEIDWAELGAPLPLYRPGDKAAE
jgi:hypothetical protein